jgi:hypothetical protein
MLLTATTYTVWWRYMTELIGPARCMMGGVGLE